jgi:hypothetical protein
MVLEAEPTRTRPPARRLLITDPDTDWCRHVGDVVEPSGVEPVISDSAERTYEEVAGHEVAAVILGSHWQRPDSFTGLLVDVVHRLLSKFFEKYEA